MKNETPTEPTSKQQQELEHAAVKFPPPLLFLILLMLTVGLHRLVPLSLGLPSVIRLLGGVIVIGGVALAVQVAVVYRQRATAIEPWKPTSALVTDGVYAWTRNPIYLGFCLVNLGLGVSADNVWMMLSCLPGALGVYLIAIAKEEAYLQRRFGQEYLDYKSRVRRWF